MPAAAYYLRGDECPRCLTPMEPAPRPTPQRPPLQPAPPQRQPAVGGD